MVLPAEKPGRSPYNIQVLAYKVLKAGLNSPDVLDKLSGTEHKTMEELLVALAPPSSPDRAAVEKQTRETREQFAQKVKGNTLGEFDTEFAMSLAAASIHVCNAVGQLAQLVEVTMEAKRREAEKRRIILPGQ